MAYWPGNVRNYQETEEVELICRYCLKAFHSQVILSNHEAKCPQRDAPADVAPATLTLLRPVPHTAHDDHHLHQPPPRKIVAFKSASQLRTLVVGSGGRVVKKIIVKSPSNLSKTSSSIPSHHSCPHCSRGFARQEFLDSHIAAHHPAAVVAAAPENDDASAEIDVITTVDSPTKASTPPPSTSKTAKAEARVSISATPSPSKGINWEDMANKKVNYPIALKKIPIGKRTGGKFWRIPTLKSGLPLVLKVVGGSGMEELSESQKPLFCSVCRFLFKTSKEMRAHVVQTHLDQPISSGAALAGPTTRAAAALQRQHFAATAAALGDEEEEEEGDEEMVEEEEEVSQEPGQVEVMPEPMTPPSTRKRRAGAVVKMAEEEVNVDDSSPPSRPTKKFSCEECDVEFRNSDNIVEHLRKVHRQKIVFKCSKCDKFFAAKAKLSRHEQVHLKMETGPSAYECEYCGKQFVYDSYLRRHRASHTGEKFYTCTVCGENFRSQGRLVIHKATAHEGGGGVASLYSCPKCGKAFPYKSYLERHVKTHISDVPKSCPHCHQAFKVESSLQKHIYKEHEGRGLLGCPHCDKKFLYPSYLERHQSVHNAARAHQCPMCNKRFSLRGTLLDHLKSHLPSADDVLPKSVACCICNNKYRHESNLERHMQTMHPREWMDSLYGDVPDARFEETVETAEEEDVHVEFIADSAFPQ